MAFFWGVKSHGRKEGCYFLGVKSYGKEGRLVYKYYSELGGREVLFHPNQKLHNIDFCFSSNPAGPFRKTLVETLAG